jgi:2-polyprenyl-6-methoxyphenol hydroxylase-like FAD-dependent oxidoreductase
MAAYQEHRKKRAEKMVRHGRRMGRLAQVHNPFLAFLRDELFEHTPPDKFKEIAADMAAGR